jgi:ribosomal subunit interface protein
MNIIVTGQKLDVGEALSSHIEDSLDIIIEKYFADALDAEVTLSHDGRQIRADISIHVGRNIYVRAHDTVDDPYAAFDVAAAHIAKRLRRYKRRLKDHHGQAGDIATQPAQQYVLAETKSDPDSDQKESDGENTNPVIIAETMTEIEQLSVSEAVMRMDLADQSALMFRNAKTGELNVVYSRHDGNIGWIEPKAN